MGGVKRSLFFWILVAIALAGARAEAVTVTGPALTRLSGDEGAPSTYYSGACADYDTSIDENTAVSSACGSFNKDGILVESMADISGSITSSTWPDPIVKSSFAQVLYSFSINLGALGQPPFMLTSVPVSILASGEISVSSSGQAGGEGGILVSLFLKEGGGPILVAYTGANLPPTTGGNQGCCDPLRVQVGTGEYQVIGQVSASILARCDPFSQPGACLPSTAEYTGVLDPTVVFDQAAFDAEYGEESFVLSDYYTIDYSPNLPEPSSTAMLACGAAFVATAGRLRIRSRRS